eukprot:SAG31_NODE_1520_length_8024_cov_7.506625_6_plen_59_part_00
MAGVQFVLALVLTVVVVCSLAGDLFFCTNLLKITLSFLSIAGWPHARVQTTCTLQRFH